MRSTTIWTSIITVSSEWENANQGRAIEVRERERLYEGGERC